MKTEKRKIGDVGEGIACQFLEKHGFRIIERNYLKKWGEIDIIAEKDKRFHFIEVKTVTRDLSRPAGPNDHEAEENVHEWKRERMRKTIFSYLAERRIEDEKYQVDVIAVYIDPINKKARVRHLPDVLL